MRMAYITDELLDRACNAIWPLENLSSDDARDRLREDMTEALEAIISDILAAHRADLMAVYA